MKVHGLKLYYLQGDTIATIENNHRTDRKYGAREAAAEAYNAMPGKHYAAPWPIQTRKAARAAGQSHYYTGKLCKSNHDARRLVKSNGVCSECNNRNVAEYHRRKATGQVPVRLTTYRCKAAELTAHAQTVNDAHGPAEGCEVCREDSTPSGGTIL